METILNYSVYFILILVFYQLLLLLYYTCLFIYKFFLLKEVDYNKRYGSDSYVIITGASSGQGYFFAHEFAKRNFNLILIGSKRTQNVIKEFKTKYKNTKIVFILKDFRLAYKEDFFDNIIEAIEKVNGNISILVNNVAHRSAWAPYHKMPQKLINDSIIVGTIVQSQLSRIVIPYFIKRNNHNAIINITAQCLIPTFGFGEILSNEISVPFLSVYEGANAFGFYQANSLENEYKKYNYKIDFLNVMPGAVITENTQFLKDTLFSIKADDFVKNIMKLIGNINGVTYAHWGHAISVLLINMFPFLKKPVLHNTGSTIVSDLMNKPNKKY
jgi:17beta-estradiol 17-dehydrogenase / very-long-chain 3-oxoacyl-CoA reductase